MSVTITHILEAYETPSFDISKKIVEDGIIQSVDKYMLDRNYETHVVHVESVIDYSKCNKELYEEYKKEVLEEGNSVYIMKSRKADEEPKALKAGFVAIKEDDTWIKYRKDWTEEDLKSELTSSRIFLEDGHIMWYKNYTWEATPAEMITKTYPDIPFRYIEYCEQERVHDAVYKDGKCIKDFLEESEDDEFSKYMNKPIC
ncbi:MAG: hypothetical protein E7272_07515 [Pseudobutyrivibrio ruminis]|uniref:Uncharacterized protein n=1 Tax=Pseudobutyrivibrio ruminis TaxID=46206 RepID=A0A927YMC4_9FIRM|nr:hypothetical protein [Pseudobutyrivibrio ruminis]